MSLPADPILSPAVVDDVIESWARARQEYEGTRLTFESLFADIAAECVDLLVEKQKAYGPKNIESLGFYGVFSRMDADKLSRLRNMMNGRVVKGRIELDWATIDAGDESIEDTLKDIANYAMILLAVYRSQWSPPLARDL